MQFAKGDKVRFLNETGEGVVTKVMDNGMVMVETTEGFEYPYPANQLVPAEPINEKDNPPQEEPEIPLHSGTTTLRPGHVPAFAKGVYVAFLPENEAMPSAGEIALCIFNNSTYIIAYSVSVKTSGRWECISDGRLEPFENIEDGAFTLPEIDGWNTMKTDVIFFKREPYSPVDPASKTVKLKSTKFFRDAAFSFFPPAGQRAYVITVADLEPQPLKTEKPVLTNEDIQRMLLEKEKQSAAAKRSVPHLKNQVLEKEVDLHIEELLDNWSGMSNGQLLDIQLRHVQQELDEAIAQHLRKIIFIHGIGNGRLKQEVRRILSGYKGIRFYDASFQRYGFGATEVEIL